MRILIHRSLWGLGPDPERAHTVVPTVAAAGYDGIVVPSLAITEAEPFRAAVAEGGLAVLAQVFTFGRTVEEHLEWFRRGVVHARDELGAAGVLAQAGRDGFDDDDARRFLTEALAVEADEGVPVAHETHRGRLLFHPRITLRLLERFDGLRVACDLSHWVCVTERLALDDDVLVAVAERARHIDARVGHEQGPQVSDPRAPEWARHLEVHEAWWDHIVAARARAGDDTLTVAPEFGPPPYQPVQPHTQAPLADIGELNDWMAARLRRRYVP